MLFKNENRLLRLVIRSTTATRTLTVTFCDVREDDVRFGYCSVHQCNNDHDDFVALAYFHKRCCMHRFACLSTNIDIEKNAVSHLSDTDSCDPTE